MEKIQRDVSHNHRLVPGPELEEKALVLKQLGETLTELKGEPRGEEESVRHVVQGGSPCCTSTTTTATARHCPPCCPSSLVLGAAPSPAHSFWSPQLTSQACRARCG